MYIVATDMDRTLLPNGKQIYDDTMPIFSNVVKKYNLSLIYVTGRNLREINEGVKKYNAPKPDFAIAEVGSRIYIRKKGKLVEDKNYIKYVKSQTKNWNIKNFKKQLSEIKELRLQEKFRQNPFKLSYYVDGHEIEVYKKVNKEIKKITKDASVVYSQNEAAGVKYLDILPKKATKITALEYLRKKLKLKKDNIVYCGDSGNDYLPLTSGYKAIIVKNAIKPLKREVKKELKRKKIKDNLYIAKGRKKLNGYYVSGILEGLIKFKFINKKDLLH